MDIGDRVRISYPIDGAPTGATWTIVEKNAVAWLVVPNVPCKAWPTWVPFNCVRPHNQPANYRD